MDQAVAYLLDSEAHKMYSKFSLKPSQIQNQKYTVYSITTAYSTRGIIPDHGIGFPGSSVGKETTCNAGDPGSIPGSGRSTGEGIAYPLQYSWASLVTQLVKKNPPTMRETWDQFLGWEEPLEKEKATHSSILAWRIPWTV